MTQENISTFELSGHFQFVIDGQEATIELPDVEIISEDIPGWLVANEGQLTVALDITVTPELKKEGIARELVNRIQNIRKSNGYDIVDKINITLQSDDRTDEAVRTYKTYISNQVLAHSLEIKPLTEGQEMDLDDFKLWVRIEKVCPEAKK
jgi:isoleucyl-tRNA synthetase